MILLRHGQSEFNLHLAATRVDPGIEDPRLTEYGHVQAARAADHLADKPIRRIIASPYTRAIQTAAPIARRLGLKVEIQLIVRERFGLPCDIGTPRERLARSWPEHDFSAIPDKWWPDTHETADDVTGRARLFRAQIQTTPDWAETLVVSHWGFILCMTGQNIGNGETITCDPHGPPPEQTIWRS